MAKKQPTFSVHSITHKIIINHKNDFGSEVYLTKFSGSERYRIHSFGNEDTLKLPWMDIKEMAKYFRRLADLLDGEAL